MNFKDFLRIRNKKKMANEKFALNFTLIDQIVYEIITNQFTPIPIAAPSTYFCVSNLSFLVITDAPILQISFHNTFFSINFKNMFAKKKLSVYI